MKKTHSLAILILVVSSLACNLPFFQSSNNEDDQSSEESDTYEVVIEDKSVLEPIALSGAQRQVLLTKGEPNRFSLMFSDGMREETWYYDHLGYEVTFRNGDVYTENDGATPVDAIEFVTIYSPWQFNGGMGLSGLLVITEADSFAIESLKDAFLEDVSLVYLKGLDAGLRGDDLLFVRTIPVGEGARTFDIPVVQSEATSQPDTASEITNMEAMYSGTHTYDYYCKYSDGTVEEESDQVTWTFTDEAVFFDGDGPFSKITENYYGFKDDYGELFIHFKENVVTITGELIEQDDSGNQISVTFACALTQD